MHNEANPENLSLYSVRIKHNGEYKSPCENCQHLYENLSFISLEVRTSNIKAISLYEKFGYKTEGVRKNFYDDPREDALIMTKRF